MKKEIKGLIVEHGKRHTGLKDLQIDFAKLSEKLRVNHSINLTEQSLKKIFKAIKINPKEKPTRKTLDRLSLFAGFQSWKELQDAFMGK